MNEWNGNVGYRKDMHTIEALSAGSYYIRVTGYRYRTYYASTGNYVLTLDTSTTLADAQIKAIPDKTYTGKAIVPSVTVTYQSTVLRKGVDYTVSCNNNKNPGKATMTIRGAGAYTGTNSTQFYILPKKFAWKSVKNKGRGTVELKWKKDSTVSGYEIYRSYNSKYGWNLVKTLSEKKTSYKDKYLYRGSTYYFKIRSYKKRADRNYMVNSAR